MRTWREVRKERHVLELEISDGDRVLDQGSERILFPYDISAQWDGCVDVTQYFNGYDRQHECSDTCQCQQQTFHICDIGAFIDLLQDVKRAAEAHFAQEFGGWPG